MSAVRDLSVPPSGRPARLYRPTDAATALALYLHGGGWVIGDLETHDRACRRLAATSGVAVLALDYRRAPEHPWPAAVDDAVIALQWIASHLTNLEHRNLPERDRHLDRTPALGRWQLHRQRHRRW
jgi:acetyl esterase